MNANEQRIKNTEIYAEEKNVQQILDGICVLGGTMSEPSKTQKEILYTGLVKKNATKTQLKEAKEYMNMGVVFVGSL